MGERRFLLVDSSALPDVFLKVLQAKELLASTDLSVDDIAVQVGFSSRWTLTRSFKRYEETTPGAYREQHQAGAIL